MEESLSAGSRQALAKGALLGERDPSARLAFARAKRASVGMT